MAVAFSKQTAFNDGNVKSTGGTPVTQAITVNAATNCLILCVSTFDATGDTGSQCTPSGVATTWSKLADLANTTGGARVQIWMGSGTLTSGTLSLSFSLATFYACNLSEWSGLSTKLDSAIAWGTGTWTATGSTGYTATAGTANQTISAPTAGSLVLHACGPSNDGTLFTYTSSTTAQTSLTGTADAGLNCSLIAAYAITAASGTYSMGSPTGTPVATTTDGWAAVAVRPTGVVAAPLRAINRSALNRSARW